MFPSFQFDGLGQFIRDLELGFFLQFFSHLYLSCTGDDDGVILLHAAVSFSQLFLLA